MASRKRTVELEVVADTKQATVALKQIGDNTGKMSNQFKTAGNLVKVAMGAQATQAVLGFANDSIAAFSDLEQSLGGTKAVFGSASGAIDAFAKNSADSIGLAESEFRTATTLIGGQLKRMTGDVDFAAEQSIKLTQAGADLAATYGGTTAEAVDAFAAALRGEADPAERFNLDLKISKVNAKAVELGLAATTSAVDDNARAQALLALVMEQGADAQGQFGREADTVSGQLQRQEAAAKDAQASIGRWLAPFKNELGSIVADVADIGDGIARIGGEGKQFADLVGSFFKWAPILGEVNRFLGGVADFFNGDDSDWSIEKYEKVRDVFGETRDQLHNFAGAAEEATGATDGLTPSAEALAFQMEREGDAAKYAREELVKKRNALREIHNPLFTAFQTTLNLAEAEEELATATRKYGDDSDEAVAAAGRMADANATLEGILMDLKTQGIDPTGAAARTMLSQLGVPPPVINRLFAQFDEIERNFEGRRFDITVTAPDLNAVRSGNNVYWESDGRRSFHRGGYVGEGLATGTEVPAVLQAGETVLPIGARGGGGGNVVNITVVDPSDRLLAELMEKRRRAQ